jgi:hypothetical protein
MSADVRDCESVQEIVAKYNLTLVSTSGTCNKATYVHSDSGVYFEVWFDKYNPDKLEARLSAFPLENSILQLVTPSFGFPHKFFARFWHQMGRVLSAVRMGKDAG